MRLGRGPFFRGAGRESIAELQSEEREKDTTEGKNKNKNKNKIKRYYIIWFPRQSTSGAVVKR